ncbi:hypothetical protein CLHOM_14430 [Clostridium homopropionicum DSM 5847]|uniref:Uncharacterized protein n=1 Tax=Clostridium homopropionicum DSM 5847 TaxID=1121318 RepID=A0A0L6ZBT3_9CLOT|nr:hypothetical protein [Clostridium homopropionicum]KOA20238.1 hypothetical protein CLHOM_14430 [Clostridium homopropionicum DSM 5847]SFG57997.1 hypothetical protein SAMN04488501_11128 [Clostridium homopropionicum]
MIKDLNIIHYKDFCFYIFLINNTLYISEGNNIKVIDKSVLRYTLTCNNYFLWICYYTVNYSVFIIEFDLENKVYRNIYNNEFLFYKPYTQNIDSLNLIVNSYNNIQIIFRGWSNFSKTGLIFHCNTNTNNISLITSSNCASYNNPFTICNKDDTTFILICEDFNDGKYTLYNLLTNRVIARFTISDINNMSFINYKNRLLIFYNKLHKKNLSIYYRELIVKHNNGYLNDECSLYLPENILNPNVSSYMGKIYVVWHNTNPINIAVSDNLKTWNYNYITKFNNSNLVKATIIKITKYNSEKLKTYINASKIYLLLSSFENKENVEIQDNVIYDYESLPQIYKKMNLEYSLKEKALYERYLNTQIENLTHSNQIEEYHKNICNNYLHTIGNLIKFLEEKDKIINSLLNMK